MKLLIVEDEASIMDRLVRLARSILKERIETLHTAINLSEALALIETHQDIDLLLLDLNLEGRDGFDILKDLASRSFQTIVVSAYTRRAIEAYELGVLDFVPKPFDEERLGLAFSRVTESVPLDAHFAKYLAVRSAGRIELISLEEIEYVQADGPCSLIQKTDGAPRCHDKMLKTLQQILPPHFERVHKSFLANMQAIDGMIAGPDHQNVLTFPSGRTIPLSRSFAKAFRARLETRDP
ncbi:LytTR family DNA-binding domain-containing protein [Pelagicoccus sp. SDUM812003]|uniref:LytR/AlgR family response regulator transcription factor n=1 Tax=Pelagicoccus sp. SDUM812003 TaxID=3041267 RepID=UPI0028100D61|nr:LytTR family DNA-binding domain-containing protein [Pelagicoccus sp. SDUM812003]MDQ8204486.1 LytTR family DNA-binding domain-containing protein [Pelagicoccus sp. SDUM812003]